jgi:CheY-like chemotaxis protein
MPELKHILLVEDDSYDTELIMTGLAENNLANVVVAVRDGEEALDSPAPLIAFSSDCC